MPTTNTSQVGSMTDQIRHGMGTFQRSTLKHANDLLLPHLLPRCVPFLISSCPALHSFSFYSGWDDTAIGGINLREDSNETIAGYQRNAARLFGEESQNVTNTATTTGPRPSFTPPNNEGSALSRREQGFTALLGILVVVALSATFL